MTKRKKSLDNLQTCLDFDSPIDAYTRLREQLTTAPPPVETTEGYQYEEYLILIASACKRAIKKSGFSRESLLDAVNDYFGWPRNDKRKSLSLHMLNNYLSKPSAYPMPAPITHAIMHITRSTDPIAAMAEMEGGQFISRDEVNTFTLGKIDNALAELQRLKKTFRVR